MNDSVLRMSTSILSGILEAVVLDSLRKRLPIFTLSSMRGHDLQIKSRATIAAAAAARYL